MGKAEGCLSEAPLSALDVTPARQRESPGPGIWPPPLPQPAASHGQGQGRKREVCPFSALILLSCLHAIPGSALLWSLLSSLRDKYPPPPSRLPVTVASWPQPSLLEGKGGGRRTHPLKQHKRTARGEGGGGVGGIRRPRRQTQRHDPTTHERASGCLRRVGELEPT